MSRSRLLVALLLTMTLAVAASAGASEFIDEQYHKSPPPTRDHGGFLGYFISDEFMDFIGPSHLYAGKYDTTGGYSSVVLCTSPSDAVCRSTDFWDYRAYSPVCSTSISTDCIESVVAIRNDGSRIPGELADSQLPAGPNDFGGNSALGIPDGAQPTLWTFAGVSHPGGNEFLVSAVATANWRNGEAVPPGQLRLNINAVSRTNDPSFRSKQTLTTVEPLGRPGMSLSGRDEGLYMADGVMLSKWPFPAGYAFELTIRRAQPVAGWLHGRMSSPQATVALAPYGQRITVTAEPVRVPILDTWQPWDAIPSSLRQLLDYGHLGGTYYFGKPGDAPEQSSAQRFATTIGSESTMNEFLQWLPLVRDSATAVPWFWTLGSMNAGNNRCLGRTDKLMGIVATNATAYLAGPPKFITATQTLDYKVAAPHFTRTGETFLGTYDLLVRSDAARCLYGFSEAPLSATVSVLSASGETQAATTVVAERDGWLSLRAAGFTFSDPTIKILLAQKAVARPMPAPKRAIITCVKGKVTKKVSGSKCPVGWKKK